MCDESKPKNNPKDARFVGSPVDFIVFDELDAGNVEQVVFIEVKTGSAALTKRERQVRDAILAKRVKWDQMRVEGPGAATSGAPNASKARIDLEDLRRAVLCGFCKAEVLASNVVRA